MRQETADSSSKLTKHQSTIHPHPALLKELRIFRGAGLVEFKQGHPRFSGFAISSLETTLKKLEKPWITKKKQHLAIFKLDFIM